MRISQKLDYAQRAVMHLSKSYDGKSVARLDDISEREAIPSSFLVQILTDLKKAGIVVSKRGKAGGYLLGKAPSSVSIKDVIEAVEPQLIEDNHQMEGDSAGQLMPVWREISEAFNKSVSSVTFDDLITEEKDPMWFI